MHTDRNVEAKTPLLAGQRSAAPSTPGWPLPSLLQAHCPCQVQRWPALREDALAAESETFAFEASHGGGAVRANGHVKNGSGRAIRTVGQERQSLRRVGSWKAMLPIQCGALLSTGGGRSGAKEGWLLMPSRLRQQAAAWHLNQRRLGCRRLEVQSLAALP